MRKKHYTDEEQLTLWQKGEPEGFAWFFRQLYPSLTFYCFKITADKEVSEEIASQAFIKIWQRHRQFSNAHSIKAYLYRIVRNDAIKYLNREKRKASATKEVIYLYGHENEKDHFTSLVTAETSRQLLEAINALPAECSKVFKLLYVEGLSVHETAEALNLSPSTVKTQKKRGIEALRKSLPLPLMVMVMVVSFFQG